MSSESLEALKGLKVAVVGPLPPPVDDMSNQTQQLAQLLEQAGVQVEFVPVNAPYVPGFVAGIKGLRAVFRLLPYCYNLWQKIRKADVVHIMASSGWPWHLSVTPAVWTAHWLKKPVIVNYCDREAQTFFRKSWHWVKPTIEISQAVIVPTAYLQRVFDNQRVEAVIVPNIFDLEHFNVDVARTGERKAGAPHLVVTRKLEKTYGVDIVLQAFQLIKAQCSESRLTVAGSGSQENELKALANSLGLQSSVTFTGRLDSQQVAQLYHEADLMLNAGPIDISPKSLIEALACGLPVVSINVGAIPDLLTHAKAAFLVPPNEPEKLADAALLVLADAELRNNLVTQGQVVAAGFDKHRVLDLLANVYHKAMA